MKSIVKKLLFFHPLAFTVFFVLAVFRNNMGLLEFKDLWRPFLVALIISVVLIIIFKKFFPKHKAVVFSSLVIIFYFIFNLLSQRIFYFNAGPILIPNYYILIPTTLFFLVFVGYILIKSQTQLEALSNFLNITAGLLLITQIYQVAVYEYRNVSQIQGVEAGSDLLNFEELSEIPNKSSLTSETLPDIYYIIMDGYARQDILQELYNFNNGEFINFLKEKGFFVGEESQANYIQTLLSMTTTLNMQYLDEFSKVMKDSNDRKLLTDELFNNNVVKVLKEKGYKTVKFPPTIVRYEDLPADIYYDFQEAKITPFEKMLVPKFATKYFFDDHKEKILYTFKELPQVANISEPTFAYIHFLMPHTPFVFDSQGNIPDDPIKVTFEDADHDFNEVEKIKFRAQYVEAVKFTNDKLKILITELIQNSPNQPIIILQSDHGPGMEVKIYRDQNPDHSNLPERFSILNAYYFPTEWQVQLSKDITPVNTFRVIFNHLFNAQLPLLENKNYFSTYEYPYRFLDVTEKIIEQRAKNF